MSYLCDLHSHTNYCDGKSTPEEMILSAIDKGCQSFGISGHSPIYLNNDWCISEENTERYLSELYSLKEKYADQIEFYVGFEADMYSIALPKCDYKIASLHYVEKNGAYFEIDYKKSKQIETVTNYFKGDFYAYCENYYNSLKSVIERTGGDVIGHLDLVTKYNGDGELFDEADPRYLKAATDTIAELVKYGLPFEINTGVISRGYRKYPYPSRTLLTEIRRLGGKIMFNSDAHRPDMICAHFDNAKELAKSCGFSSHVVLSKGRFVEVSID